MTSILLLLLAYLTAVAYGQYYVPMVVTVTALKDFDNGSLNVNVQGVDYNIPTSVLQVATSIQNLINVSVQRGLSGDTTIDVPVTVNADSVVLKIWGNSWVVKKADVKSLADALELYRKILLTYQDAYYYFVQ